MYTMLSCKLPLEKLNSSDVRSKVRKALGCPGPGVTCVMGWMAFSRALSQLQTQTTVNIHFVMFEAQQEN